MLVNAKEIQERLELPAKALSHPLRIEILIEFLRQMRLEQESVAWAEHDAQKQGVELHPTLTRPLISSNKLSKILEKPLGNISHHRKVLVELEFLVAMATKPRRGAVETFYELPVEQEVVLYSFLRSPAPAKPLTLTQEPAELATAA